MKFLYTTSLAFIMLLPSLKGQEQPTPEKNDSPKLSISLDVGGLTIKPLLAAVLDQREYGFRIQPKVAVHFTETFYTELAFGHEQLKDKQVSSDFRDYKLKGYFAKPGVGFSYLEDKLFIGTGVFFTSQYEAGTVTIGGEYFAPFEQRKARNVDVFGVYFKLGSNYPISPKLSVGIELNYMAGRVSENYQSEEANQKIEAIAGGGYNILANSENWAMTFPGFIYMKYKF